MTGFDTVSLVIFEGTVPSHEHHIDIWLLRDQDLRFSQQGGAGVVEQVQRAVNEKVVPYVDAALTQAKGLKVRCFVQAEVPTLLFLATIAALLNLGGTVQIELCVAYNPEVSAFAHTAEFSQQGVYGWLFRTPYPTRVVPERQRDPRRTVL